MAARKTTVKKKNKYPLERKCPSCGAILGRFVQGHLENNKTWIETGILWACGCGFEEKEGQEKKE